MVARGDLGVEIPPAEVPLIQKELVKRAKKGRIPVIIATQMMESMIDCLTASRAEVNDVANSVMDGADAVMLSGETSVGKYPVEVIQTMSSIIHSVEHSDLITVPQKPPNIRTLRFITKSICYHAVHIANDVQAKAICTLTNSGYTAFQVSAWRPNSHILVFTSNRRILTQLNLIWGVKAFFYDSFESTDKTVEQINKIVGRKLRENNKLIVETTTSWCFVGEGLRLSMELFGPEYSMFVNTLDPDLKVFFSRKVVGSEGDDLVEKQNAESGGMPVVSNEAEVYGYTAENRHMVESFLSEKRPEENFDDGLDVTRLLIAAYISAEQGKTIKLPNSNIEDFIPAVSQGNWNPKVN